MTDNSKITELIHHVFSDIRAEAVIGDMVENGLEPEDIIIFPNGIFKRRYSRDIDAVEEVKLKNGEHLTGIQLNRDGTYDSLPEGLFHGSSEKTVNERGVSSGESKKLKIEEKAAREFFLPFENEIIHQRVLLELQERKILRRFSEKLFDFIYPELWESQQSLKGDYVYKMAMLLHFSHRVAGNPGITAKCLGLILDEKVEVEITGNELNNSGEMIGVKADDKRCKLGKGELGIDFICGEKLKSTGKTMIFKIGPLRNTSIVDYLENGNVSRFLSGFYSYFVPASLDAKLDVFVDPSKRNFKLSDWEGGPALGYETSL